LIARFIVKEYWIMMDEIKKQEFSRLDASHHIFAGMKAMLTYIVEEDSHTARRACGGAGY